MRLGGLQLLAVYCVRRGEPAWWVKNKKGHTGIYARYGLSCLRHYLLVLGQPLHINQIVHNVEGFTQVQVFGN